MQSDDKSLSLFEEVVKNLIFKNTPIFVFLNKKDLFEEMIPNISLKTAFQNTMVLIKKFCQL